MLIRRCEDLRSELSHLAESIERRKAACAAFPNASDARHCMITGRAS